MLLAIDSATQLISLALYDQNARTLIAEETWYSPNNHTVELAPSVSAILKRAGKTIPDITALAVCIGPGSYSALRIGVSFAKGIAAVRRLPLVGVSTFEIMAGAYTIPFFTSTGMLIVTAQAGRGRVIAQRFGWQKDHWDALSEPSLHEWGELVAQITLDSPPTLITGEVNESGQAAIADAQAATPDLPLMLAGSSLRLRRAGYLAQIACERMSSPAGETVGDEVKAIDLFDAAQVTPLYIKTKDAP